MENSLLIIFSEIWSMTLYLPIMIHVHVLSVVCVYSCIVFLIHVSLIVIINIVLTDTVSIYQNLI